MRIIKSIILTMVAIIFVSCSCKQKEIVQADVVELISVVDLQKLDTNIQLIDIRTQEEYQEGYIKNAKNINFFDDDFLNQMSLLDKSKPVYVYCKSGGRSAKASTQLKEAGFTKIYDLEGGITDWIEKEKEITNRQ